MECLRTGLPRELVPHPEISVKMEKVNGSLKSFHYTLSSLTLCPPPSSMVWAQVILPSNTWQWDWRTSVGAMWLLLMQCLVHSVCYTDRSTSLCLSVSLSHTYTHIPWMLSTFSNIRYFVVWKKMQNHVDPQEYWLCVWTVLGSCDPHLWGDLYWGENWNSEAWQFRDNWSYSLATWEVPSYQLFNDQPRQWPRVLLFLKCLVLKHFTKYLSGRSWVCRLMTWNQTELSESKMIPHCPPSLPALVTWLSQFPRLRDGLCSRGEPHHSSKIQLLLHLLLHRWWKESNQCYSLR